jgi:aspartate racemase
MKTLGLIGGTSWLSAADYYKIINQEINKQLGGLNSAKLFLYSLNYEEFKPSADPSEWERIASQLTDISTRLETAGAECIILCANTPHMVADNIQKNISIPLIHIAEVTAKAIVQQKIKTVALLGTKFTMEQSFFKDKLTNAGITALIPNEPDRAFIHDSIFNELGKGIFTEATKQKYLNIINKLIEEGAEGVIFGCTEIPMLIKEDECRVPVFDTLMLHAKAAAKFALGS